MEKLRDLPDFFDPTREWRHSSLSELASSNDRSVVIFLPGVYYLSTLAAGFLRFHRGI